jgi:fructose-1,6-bisphosphatase/inositol monophosphatase family enzyme
MQVIETLERVATECGRLILSLRSGAMKAEDKAEQLGAHFSTYADRKSQELGLKILNEDLPSELVLAEEQENLKWVPPDCTVFDPLDGTTIFFNGFNDFGVSLCTMRDGVPTFAATYFPVKEILISAVLGQGCYIGGFQRGRRVSSISWHGLLDKTLVSTDVGSWTVRQGTFDLVLKPLATRFNIVSPISSTVAARHVLFGESGVFYNLGVAKIWDAAAMALAITEAGGVACNHKGGPISWDNINCDWIVAGNQTLANIVLEHSRFWSGRKT